MAHDFVKFPELTNAQMEIYYFESPHKQIFSDFRATVTKVHDGDTITVRAPFRDFTFPVRFLDTNAPELNEEHGKDSQLWLENIIFNEEIDIIINPSNRVDKWGRLLGIIYHKGMNINQQSINEGKATSFENRMEGKLPNIDKEMAIEKWL